MEVGLGLGNSRIIARRSKRGIGFSMTLRKASNSSLASQRALVLKLPSQLPWSTSKSVSGQSLLFKSICERFREACSSLAVGSIGNLHNSKESWEKW